MPRISPRLDAVNQNCWRESAAVAREYSAIANEPLRHSAKPHSIENQKSKIENPNPLARHRSVRVEVCRADHGIFESADKTALIHSTLFQARMLRRVFIPVELRDDNAQPSGDTARRFTRKDFAIGGKLQSKRPRSRLQNIFANLSNRHRLNV
jgi:hypothetical protein